VTKVLGVLNKLNVTIYSIDARGIATIDRAADRGAVQALQGFDSLHYKRELQDSLSVIAAETGGIAIINSQNYQKGLAEITSDMSQQYWLCTNLPPRKKGYHSIDVKVNRSGLKVRHRKGYID
jgi:VWFA-related protein